MCLYIKFCNICHNLFNTRTDKDEKGNPILILFCKSCSNTKVYNTEEAKQFNPLVSTDYELDFGHISTERNCYNPTICYLKNKKCPECNSSKIKPNIYNLKELKYSFLCCECKIMWNNS